MFKSETRWSVLTRLPDGQRESDRLTAIIEERIVEITVPILARSTGGPASLNPEAAPAGKPGYHPTPQLRSVRLDRT